MIEHVNDHIKKMRDQYGDKSADVKLAVSNMLELLAALLKNTLESTGEYMPSDCMTRKLN